MGLLYNIAKWSVNRLIKQGVDLSDIVETDQHTKKIREAAAQINEDLFNLQDEFGVKRAEIIKLQSELLKSIEPTYITMLAESSDSMLQTTMTKHWIDGITEINDAIAEHEIIVNDFNKKHEQLRILESKL